MSYTVTALFLLSSLLAVLAGYSVFIFKNIIHVIISLALFLVMVSIFFLFLGQPLLAVLQLLIMVGGLATYFLIGAATARFSDVPHTNLRHLFIMSILIFTAFAYILLHTTTGSYPTYPTFTGIGVSYSQPLLYLVVITLFTISIISMLLFKKIDIEARK